MGEVSSEKDQLRESATLIEHQLQGANEDIGKYISLYSELEAILLCIKVEAESIVSPHRGGAVAIYSCVERDLRCLVRISLEP